ncbi:LysR substrate-binding domain-containing protein [Celeribacter arenosi]|uniref:LysR family transcriptional regulator n=1 Tax=Celeribacter arenosi TaxID=792649 RepID=A0ABP7JV32_9RHOB
MSDLLARGLKMPHLRLAAALHAEEKLSAAANRLAITQPAASRLAAEIEGILGTPLYARSGRGIQLTAEGRLFAERAARVLRDIVDVGRDVKDLTDGSAGHVAMGAVTGPAIEFVLPLIREARIAHPRVQVRVEVSPSDVLCQMLLDGHLDFALARPPLGDAAASFAYRPVDVEPMSLIARSEHPLFRGAQYLDRSKLVTYDWVMPHPGSILRVSMEAKLRALGLTLPARVLNTSSFLLTLATISQTNAIAPIATSVARAFESGNGVRILPVDFETNVPEFGIITRAHGDLSAAATAFLAMAERAVATRRAELPPTPT